MYMLIRIIKHLLIVIIYLFLKLEIQVFTYKILSQNSNGKVY